MSLLLRNELRIAIGGRRCEASVWHAGWPARRIAHVQGPGSDAAALTALLSSLSADGQALPRTARLCLDDDLLHYALLPADGPWSQAQTRAVRHFSDVLGDDGLLVARRLLPGARQWLTVAADGNLVSAWSQALAEQGCTLRAVQAALLEDLWRHRHQLAMTEGVVACLRAQGLALAGWRQGRLQSLAWERCDMQQPILWTQRIQAFAARLALGSDGAPATGAAADTGVLLLAPDADLAGVQQAIAPFAHWRMAANAVD